MGLRALSTGGDGAPGWAVVGRAQQAQAEPLTFPERLSLVAPLFHLILIDEPGEAGRREGAMRS